MQEAPHTPPDGPEASILGIETSCDETAAAVVCGGRRILSNIVFSQFVTHRPYGGVVPELASREHLRAIVPVVREALAQAGHTYQTIDAIAVTQGPGLAGALLVGISFAKAVAFASGKPLIAVNHLEGHIHSVLLQALQDGEQEIRFPILSLVVSGGHTHLYLAEPGVKAGDPSGITAAAQSSADALSPGWNYRVLAPWSYRPIGQTRDDAAGEAFDKVAKLLALGYPGGPMVDALARHGNPAGVKFIPAQIKKSQRTSIRTATQTATRHQARPGDSYSTEESFDFSFSGIKTAVLRYVQVHGLQEAIDRRRAALEAMANPSAAQVLQLCDAQTLDLVASFQHAVVEALVSKTLAAAGATGAQTLFVSGGVAANSELRGAFEPAAAQCGLPVLFPSRPLSTDNAAMIAAAAHPRWLARDFAAADFSADAAMKLGTQSPVFKK